MPNRSSPPEQPAVWWKDRWAWGFVLAAALLLLPHLESSGLLWQDEAETAALAQRVLTFGYPKAFDGINRINPALPMGPGDSWTYHPWLQFYITAAAFALFGATTVAARLPFALFGVVCVVATYRLTLSLLRHPGIARLTGVTTLLSVPLLLHFRQCRYYALGVFGILWVLWAHRQIRDGRRAGWWWLAAGLVVLFHSHHGAWFPTMLALGLAFWRHDIPAGQRRTAIAASLAMTILIAPWFAVLQLSQHDAAFSVKELSHHLQFYIRQINRFIFPIQAMLVVWLLRGLHPVHWWRAASPRQQEALRMIAWLLACHLAFFIVVPYQRHFRYLVHLLPLFLLAQSVLLWAWLGRRRAWLTLAAALLIATDLLHYSAPYVMAGLIPPLRAAIAKERDEVVRPRSLLWDYGYELTHAYRGPLDGVIGTLRQRAAPGDTVKTPYDDHAVIFYTGLRVEDLNRFAAPVTAGSPSGTDPDWIIPRKDWVAADWAASPVFQEIQRRYTRIETDAPDLMWENRPDPGYHKFRTARGVPPVVLYHRRRDETNAP